MLRIVALAALLLPFAGTGAWAQTDQPRAVSVDGDIALTSDYRFRGLSRSDGDPAIQGTATVTLRGGAYGGIFVSSIAHDAISGGDPETDLYAGFKRTLGGTTIDGGVTYYVYPGVRGVGRNSVETYGSAAHTLGPVTARLGGDLAWKQRGLGLVPGDRRAGIYAYGELSSGIPTTPFTVTAHLGRAFRANAATDRERYTDWSLAASYTRRRLSLTAAYVDTNRGRYAIGPRYNPGKAGFVGSVALAF